METDYMFFFLTLIALLIYRYSSPKCHVNINELFIYSFYLGVSHFIFCIINNDNINWSSDFDQIMNNVVITVQEWIMNITIIFLNFPHTH